jgi:hypothetical protein
MKRHLTFIACMIIFNVLQAQNPIAYYPLNGNANDSIGNIHGIINGATTTTDRYQYPAGAFNFGGSNQYIT